MAESSGFENLLTLKKSSGIISKSSDEGLTGGQQIKALP
jgi:hypothetical protein